MQSLLPNELKEANTKIEGMLSKLQYNIRILTEKKAEIGTDRDDASLREVINNKITELTDSAQLLQQEIEAYGNISVAYSVQKTLEEKKKLFLQRFQELMARYQSEVADIQIKMRQFLDLAEKRRETLMTGDLEDQRSASEKLQQQLDQEEVKVQAETDYMNDVINQRQNELNSVEKLVGDINKIAKTINTQVHEQRSDLVEIDQNAQEALTNAEAAEENIVDAKGHQKSGGKCLYWVLACVAAFAIVIILIIVLKVT